MTVTEIKALIKSRGWSAVDIAAYWGVSTTYLSGVINSRTRGVKYDCAFRGLPNREEVAIKRDPRHCKKTKKLVRVVMNPNGRILEALCNQYVDEGRRVVVVGSSTTDVNGKNETFISLRFVDDLDASPYVFELPDAEVTLRFGDTGLTLD